MSTRSILKQLLDSFFFLKLHFMYSFSTVVIENLYIQTSLMVALSLFRVKEGGGPIYKSEVDITRHTNSGIITAAVMVVPPVAKLQQQKLDKRTTIFTKKDEA